nr:hypothetical protein [Tanacetum cinerariifolium]
MSDHEDETITQENAHPKVVPQITTARFGGNAESKKMQKSLLKQKFEEFKISEEEGLDKGYDKMQKILTQMNILKIKPEQEDVNMKFLRDCLLLGLIDTKGYTSNSSTLSNAAFISTAGSSQGNLSYQKSGNGGHITTHYVSPGSSSSKGSLKSKCNVVDDVIYSFFANHEIDKHLVYEDLDQMNKEEFKEQHRTKIIRKFSMIAVIKIESDANLECEVVSADNAIPAGVSISAGNIAVAVVSPQSETEFALMGLSTEMMYGKKATDSFEIKSNDDSISHSNDSVHFDFSDRSSEPSTNDLQTCDSSVKCSRPNHSDRDSTDYISSVSTPTSESGDTIVIDCDKQEDFPSICSIETDVKSSKPFYFHLIKDCNLHEQRFAKRNAEGKGILGRRPTGKQVNPNRPKPIFAGQPNPVSAGQPNLISAGQPNPVTAGQPNPVSAGDGILCPRPLNIQTKSKYFYSFTHNNQQIIFLITHNSLYSFYMTSGLKGKTVVKPSAGKISGKGTIKTKNLNFKNVLYVEELQHFNLISVSQICDQSHRVFFTENECLVLFKDFPLPDPSIMILSILRKHNLYTFSLNELAPKGPLTCLIAKASQNESTLWHRRLGHVNFRNMNKLVKDSLLPTIFWSEVVATACYVLNRVLVTKPHHKTPYELLTRDKPSISYLKPFGCHVTILNTSDPLGKFDKKLDECYIVGYSISSKAYRVYNLVSRKIKKTMNLKFLENKPFVAGTGQAWMFDIDYLTDSLNYSRVSSTNLTAGSQGATPSNAGSYEDDSDSDDEPDVLIIHSTPTPVVPIVDKATTQNDGTKSDHATTNADNLGELTKLQDLQRREQVGKEEADQLGLAFLSLNLILGVGSTPIGSSVFASSTPPVSIGSTPPMSPCASPISAGRPIFAGTPTGSAGRPVSNGRPVSAGKATSSAGRPVFASRPSGSAAPIPADIHDGLKIFDCPKSGIFTSSSYDEEFSGPDTNNLASSVDVSSPSPRGSIIFILLLKYLRRNNHHDFQLCVFSCFLSQEEPTTVAQALADPDWVEAMQAEMQQFRNQKVWVFVTLPDGKRAIGTKWILKNKRDAKGIVCRNKARLVTLGHRQEERIDYTDVFAPIARIEAIRLFLVFASFTGFKAPRAWYERLSTFLLKHGYRRGTINKTLFIKKNSKDIMLVQVYVDDIIFGSTRTDWCEEFKSLMQSEFEMSSMGPLTFFLGLQVDQRLDGIFIHQEKYVANILKKFDLDNSKLASTPFEPQKIREKNVPDEPISVHLYRSMIRCLMYLTATRPDIMFAVYAAARHQVTPKTSNLLSVKRIFKSLITYLKLGLCYLQDSPFDLEAFSDSDYAGAHGDRKFTTGGLSACLVYWTNLLQGHIVHLWFLFTSAGRVTFCWLFPIHAGDLGSASEVSLPDGVKGLVATIDGTVYTVTEASIRSALQLDDLNAIDIMTNAEIFAGLREIGNIAIALICLSTGRKYNFSNMIFNVTKKIFDNMRHYQGPDMPLLAHILNQGEPTFVQAKQQEVSLPPPSPVVAPHPSPDLMLSPPRQSSPPSIPFGPAPSYGVISCEPIPDIPSSSRPSEPVLETITSPIRGDDTGGGSFHESPPRPTPATPTSSPTVGVAEEPLTLTSLLALFPTCLQRIATLEAELKATKILHRDNVVLFARRIKKLESKLKTKKRKLVLSDSENEEEARQSQELEALLDLANATLHEPSHSTTPSKPANPEQARAATIIYKRLKKQQSSSGLDFTDAAIPASELDSAGRVDSAGELDLAGRVDSAVGQDSAGRVVSAGGVDSVDGLISAGVFVAAGPTIPVEPASPIRDPSKGKAVAPPSSPVTAPTAKELADQQVAILEAERKELLEQELKQSLDAEQVYLDSLLVSLNLTNEEWISLVDQVRANPTLSAELLGADVSEDTFSVRMVDLMNKRRKAISKIKAKAKREKPMTPAQQKEFMRTFSSPSTEQPAESQKTTSVSAGATIAVGDPILAVTSVSAASSVPAGTPIAASVSTTAGAFESASEASVPIIELLDSPPKDTSLPLDLETEEHDVPLRKSSRKKSISRRRTLPSPSKSESAALPFDKDDPEAEFKKYLRQVSDDDEPAEHVSLALVYDIRTWEIIPTEFGLCEVHVITRADDTVKRFSTLRELMYWAGRADLMVLYGMVSDKYKIKRATGIGLGLWSDLRTLVTAREDIDAFIIWDYQDQWEIQSWRFYALPVIHVLETKAGDIINMFMDKK